VSRRRSSAFDAAAVRQRFHDGVDGPDFVRRARHVQRLPIGPHKLPATPFTHTERDFAIETVNTFVICLHALASQQLVNATISDATSRMSQIFSATATL
jgi:hypothetical protein